MSAKRFVIREKLLEPEDLIVQEEDKHEENKKLYRNWTKSSRTKKTANKPIKKAKTSSTKITVPAVRCSAIAKKTGEQCRNKTRNQNGYCHHH